MISFKTLRKWHKWPGIIFLLPAFIISITSILLAMDGVLKLNKVTVNFPTMAGVSGGADVKSVIITPQYQYYGTKNGLFVYDYQTTEQVAGLEGFDIRSLLLVSDTLYVATKQGLWKYFNGDLKLLLNVEVFSVTQANSAVLLVSAGKKGYFFVDFSGNKVEYGGNRVSLEQLAAPASKQTLHKLVIDLHTGEAIVGKKLMPYWVALCGIQLLVLTITGFWYVVKKRKKV